jgi:molybdenum cofactor biosynthesis enzyme MoaA
VLIERLAALGGLDVALTTNGALLPQKAEALVAPDSSVSREPRLARRRDVPAMNDVGFPVSRVLDGIAAASAPASASR